MDDLIIKLLHRELIEETDRWGNAPKKDCIFYEDVKDMNATFESCKYTGEVYKEATCTHCPRYIPKKVGLEILSYLFKEV